jgi:hypothetical protein
MNADAPPRVAGFRAKDAAARALQAEPDLAEVQTASGHVAYLVDWDWAAAERALRRATALDPHDAIAHRILGLVLSQISTVFTGGFGLGLLIASAFSTFFWWWAVGAALFGVGLFIAALELATPRD